jgi:hypothetical protein
VIARLSPPEKETMGSRCSDETGKSLGPIF